MSEQDTWAAWRAEVESWHAFPTDFIAVAYLSTEAGEALDTAIRLLIPDHDRTHDHGRNMGRELAQIIDLANTAAIRSVQTMNLNICMIMDHLLLYIIYRRK